MYETYIRMVTLKVTTRKTQHNTEEGYLFKAIYGC